MGFYPEFDIGFFMKFVLHQFNPRLGNIEYNVTQIAAAATDAKLSGADVLVSSELAICGYPPEDLLQRASFIQSCEAGITMLLEVRDILLIVGVPRLLSGKLYNCAVVLYNGEILACYAKRVLPNYGVFDEKRYFSAGDKSCVIRHQGCNIALAICEDVWQADIGIAGVDSSNSDVLVVLNASPFEVNKYHSRYKLLSKLSRDRQLPIVYVNQICGQDELVFDGGSCVVNQDSYCIAPVFFTQCLAYFDLTQGISNKIDVVEYSVEFMLYEALKLAIYDYVHKNNFNGVVFGMSGGIDSALVLVICVDALGANVVRALMMPTIYTQNISVDDSREMVRILGVNYQEYEINNLYQQYLLCFDELLGKTEVDTTEENIQARIRGNILMAISNKTKSLVVTTGNKSEMTTGYATLYGDMAGGFALLKDIAKCWVYKLALYRNSISYVIPSRIITRAPSAELRDGQYDQQSLPEYDVLDKIIELMMEQFKSSQEIINLGYKAIDVERVAKLLKLNEYKRRQAAVGPKVTTVGYGKDWRMPNTHDFDY